MRTKLLISVAVIIIASMVASAAPLQPLFGPVNGILKGQVGSPQTTAATSSDVLGLWSGTCSSTTYLRGDGTCSSPGGTGTVTSMGLTMPSGFSVSGSPITTSGTIAVTTSLSGVLKSSGGAFSAAASADILGLWTGTCGSSTFLRGDGSCQTPSGAGSINPTGTPATGNLTQWSGATTITNGDLSGDCTTAGALTITCTKTNGVAFGTFATANAATPPAIGTTTPSTGAFTAITATRVTSSIAPGFYEATPGLVALAMTSAGTNYGLIQNDAGNKWCLATGTSNAVLGTDVLCWNATGNVTIPAPSSGIGLSNAGSAVFGAPTGGSQGAGTLNAQGLYVNGASVGTVAGGGTGVTTISGIVKGNGTSPFTPGVAADIVGLFSSCSGAQYLGADGTCHTASGNVATTGTPALGNLTQFSSATTITSGNLSGDCTTSGTLAITCTKTSGVAFATSATTDATNASNIASGTLVVTRGGTGVNALSGVVKGNGTSAFSAALAADIIGLFSTCSGTQYLGADGACHTASGNVSTTGTPVSGNLTRFTGATSISNGDLSGDCTTAGALAITCTKTNGTAFAASATTNTTNASNITSGTLADARLTTNIPTLSGGGNFTTTPTINGSPILTAASTGSSWSPNDNTSNGYQQLPSGLIMQWGYAVYPGNGTSPFVVAFPTTFTHACLHAQVSSSIGGFVPGIISCNGGNISFNMNNLGSTSQAFYWTALGY